MQVRVLPGACEREDAMERLISLFREPDYESWPAGGEWPSPAKDEEPLYFKQLLEYLRQQKQDPAPSEAKELIGA